MFVNGGVPLNGVAKGGMKGEVEGCLRKVGAVQGLCL